MSAETIISEGFDIQKIVILMVIATMVAVGVKRIKIPYTVALVLVGLGLGFFHALEPVELTEQLVLFTFLPALLFEAAWNLDIRHLKTSVTSITLFATLGVCLAVGIIAATLHFTLGLPWLIALLFGTIVAPTDPVSVVAVMKQLHLDHRLAALVEGESLLNDGTSVVFFKLILALVIAFGFVIPAESLPIYLTSGLIQFLIVVGGGAIVGSLIGFAFSMVTKLFDDHLLELTFTTITAYGSFLLAESIHIPGEIPNLHLSGVIATVSAGLVMGNYGRQMGMSASTRIVVSSFWEYAGFFMNSLLFLLIGLEIQIHQLVANWFPISMAIIGVTFARAISIYTISAFSNLTKLTNLSLIWQHVLVFSGLRGALSMALVLSIPRHVLPAETREILILMVFGVVLFTLVVQGFSIGKVLKALKLGKIISPELAQYQEIKAKLKSAKRAFNFLMHRSKNGEVSEPVSIKLQSELDTEIKTLNAQMSEIHISNDLIILEDSIEAKTQILKHRKATIQDLILEGSISEEKGSNLQAEYDEELEEVQSLYLIENEAEPTVENNAYPVIKGLE